MSNEQTGQLIDLIKEFMHAECNCVTCFDVIVVALAGELQSRYRIEPLENTVKEEG